MRLILLIGFFQFVLHGQNHFVNKPNDLGYISDSIFIELIHSKKYDFIYPFQSVNNDTNYFAAKVLKNGKYGFINLHGDEIVAPIYKEFDFQGYGLLKNKWKPVPVYLYLKSPIANRRVHRVNENLFVVYTKNDKIFLIDSLANRLQKRKFLQVEYHDPELLVRLKNKNYAVIDNKANFKIPPIYQFIKYLNANSLLAKKDNKWGIISCYNRIIIPFVYDEISEFNSNAIYKVKNNSKYGLIKINGDTLLELNFDELHSMQNSRVKFKNSGLWGVFDLNGKIIVPNIYNYVSNCPNSQAYIVGKYNELKISNNSKHSIYSVRKMVYGIYHPFQNAAPKLLFDGFNQLGNTNFYVVNINSKIGLVDTLGNWILDSVYSYYSNYSSYEYIFYPNIGSKISTLKLSHNRLIVDSLSKFGMRDLKNNCILPANYNSIVPTINNCFLVVKNNKMGLIDSNASLLIPIIYRNIRKCYQYQGGNHHLLTVEDSLGNIGLANAQGNILIQPVFKEFSSIQNNLFIVKNDSLFGVIDSNGKILLPLSASKLYFANNMFLVKYAKWGIISQKMESVLPCQYNAIYPLKLGVFSISKDSLFALYNSLTKCFTEFKYQKISETYGSIYYAQMNNNPYYLKTNCKELVPMGFTMLEGYDFSSKMIVKNLLSKKYGLIDTNGILVLPCVYESLYRINTNRRFLGFDFYSFKSNGKYGLLGPDGEVILPALYDEIKSVKYYEIRKKYPNGFVVREGNKYFVVDWYRNKFRISKPKRLSTN